MFFRKVASNVRVEAGAGGADVEFPLSPKGGGRLCKNVQVMLKVVASSTNGKVGVKIRHGPDGTTFKELVSQATIAVPSDRLIVLDTTTIVGEYIQIVLLGGGTAAGDWVSVDVYEMRKPY